MGLSEMLEKSSPIQVKRKKENASAFKSLANRNTELVDESKELKEEIERLNNIIYRIEEHFVFLKMNSTGGNKEFFEDILDFIKALKELKGSDKE